MVKIRPGSRIGPFPYRIIKALDSGQGNMSDVYLASVGDNDTLDPARLVIIKISRSQDEHQDFYQDTIYNESERLRTLSHPGIVRILPIQTDNDLRQLPYAARASALPGQPWFLVLEYLEGGSLAQALQSGPLELPLALEVARSLADTLDYIHRNDQVHLDIKPENILFRQKLAIGARVEPIFIDFGIARNTGQQGLEARTIHYAPPERVMLNRGNYAPEVVPRPQPAMDVYSLGVVIYQMVTGRRPFDGRSDKSVSSAILAGNPTEPIKYKSNISPALNHLILQTMDRNPINRPTAAELVEQLDEMIGKSHVQTPPATKTPSQPRPVRVKRHGKGWLHLAMALVVLVLLALTFEAFYVVQQGEPWLPSAENVQQFNLAAGSLIDQLFQPGASPANPLATGTPESEALNSGAHSPESTPGETAAPSPSPTSVSTATKAPTSTPVATIPSVAGGVVELAPVETLAPTATARPPTSTPLVAPPTLTKTPINTPTKAPTSTAAPTVQRTNTSTPVQVNTPTRRPPATPITLPSSTPTAAVATRAPAAATPVRTVRLLAPSDGAGGYRMEFRWEVDFSLADKQAFEPIFWKDGQDPFVAGRGWGGTTRNTTRTIEFRDVAPDSYLWGVLLVETEPEYKRLAFLGGGWRFSVSSDGDSSNNSGNSNSSGGRDDRGP